MKTGTWNAESFNPGIYAAQVEISGKQDYYKSILKMQLKK
jgi:hypothetical protein